MNKGYLLLILCMSTIVNAADIARGVQTGDSSPDSSNGGYFELGVGLALFTNPFVLKEEDDEHCECPGILLGSAYRHNGAFIELASDSYDGISLGYTVWENSTWSMDVLVANLQGDLRYNKREELDENLSEAEKDALLIDRSRGYLGAGIRMTGYFGNYIAQFRVVSDYYDNNGVMSTLRIGRYWQVRNWNFHSIISAQYFSEKTSEYWIGVSEEESTTRFPAYDATQSLYFTAEVGAALPLTEHWVARSSLRYGPLSSEIIASPLIDENYDALLVFSASYAFK